MALNLSKFKTKKDIAPKTNTRKEKQKAYMKFYSKQVAKAFGLVIIAYAPVDIANGYINNVAIGIGGSNQIQYFADSARLNILSTFAAVFGALMLYSIIFRLNWSFKKSKYAAKLTEIAPQEKATAKK